jgi:predicted ATP-grasp superfamily ATP-dependent carboligase
MSARIQLFAISALLITIGASVGAQGTPPAKPPLSTAAGTAADCGAKSCEGVQSILSAVKDAKQSNDPKKMRAALDMAEQQLSGVKINVDRTTKIAQRLRDHMDKIEAQREKVKAEQSKLDSLFYPTDEFIIGD